MSETTGSTAPVGNPPADGGQTTAPPASDKWYSAIPDADTRGFAELKGWDSPEKAIQSYRNLEKFQGLPPERLAKVPDKDDAAGWGEFNKRFGWSAPDDAKDYNIEVPEGHDPSYAEGMRGVLKEAGVPKDMAEKLIKGSNGILAQLQQAETDAYNNRAANDLASLKTEWGDNYDKLSQLAQRAKQEFGSGLDATMLDLIEDVIGPANHAKLWANIGSKMGEAKFVDGKVETLGPMTPDAARARLNQLMADKGWNDRYKGGDVRARQEYQTLRDTIARAG